MKYIKLFEDFNKKQEKTLVDQFYENPIWFISKTWNLPEYMVKIILEKYEHLTISQIKQKIMNLHNLPKELKEVAVGLVKSYTTAKNGKVFSLDLHPDLIKKIKEKDLPSGFDMGISKDGYCIHTHRARGKFYETPDKIPVSEIKFIDSTG